jgi:hypothetical protein
MVNGDTIFTISGGDIQILSLVSECYTANNATASTLQYSVTTATAATQTISLASTSLASAVIGSTVSLNAASTLAEAPTVSANGVIVNTASRGVRVPSGSTIKLVIGVGSTTGTWKHYMKWSALEAGASVA